MKKRSMFISAFLVFLFIYTALHKLADIDGFRYALSKLPLVGRLAGELAIAVPLAEISIAILVAIPALRKEGLLAAFCLMTCFTIYVAAMMLTMHRLPCSCGGIISRITWPQHLVLNIILTAITSVAYKTEKHSTLYCNKQEQPNTCKRK